MAGFSIINYKGKEIAYIDYRGLKVEQMMQTLEEATEKSLKDNKKRLLLTNFTNAYAVPEFMERSKAAGKKTKHLTPKAAIVGLLGAKKILLNAYNIFTKSSMKAFEDEQKAKEWLVNN